MARPRKFVNTSDYPDFVIELMARTFYEDMLCDILKDEDKPVEAISEEEETEENEDEDYEDEEYWEEEEEEEYDF